MTRVNGSVDRAEYARWWDGVVIVATLGWVVAYVLATGGPGPSHQSNVAMVMGYFVIASLPAFVIVFAFTYLGGWLGFYET